jgi:hypothetical protein
VLCYCFVGPSLLHLLPLPRLWLNAKCLDFGWSSYPVLNLILGLQNFFSFPGFNANNQSEYDDLQDAFSAESALSVVAASHPRSFNRHHAVDAGCRSRALRKRRAEIMVTLCLTINELKERMEEEEEEERDRHGYGHGRVLRSGCAVVLIHHLTLA